jgi:hypothetical protein
LQGTFEKIYLLDLLGQEPFELANFLAKCKLTQIRRALLIGGCGFELLSPFIEEAPMNQAPPKGQ